MKRLLSLIALLLAISSFSQENSSLLFYLSGENGASADFSQGSPNPNYLSRISVIPDGISGKAIHCDTKQAYTYRAPGNIYSKKGTLAFFWRSGMHLTGTAFPIFRVAFADHSSWDMVWLRIDWNGHGFEGFVTDNNLARIRVKKDMAPADDEWVHIAISWDEGKGVRLYLDGEPAACRDTSLVLDTGLDQFGPHSRIISPYQVHSMYNMQRGGDLDELRIYSEMLTDSEIAALARAEAPEAARHPGVPANEWNRTLGFDKNLPPYMKNRETTVKRIGILEAYDIKRWYWKANDGIRETTWPGVYNRSRIEGRNDYFQLPDWDCYFDSGKKVRFNMPDEPWNYLEMIGGAFGELGLTTRQDGENAVTFAHKDKGTQHLFQMMDQPVRGQTITFSNVQQETPIQEFNAFYVHEGTAPTGVAKLSYGLSDFYNFEDSALKEMESYIAGRFEPEARTMLIALPGEGKQQVSKGKGLPIVHIVIPSDTRDLNRNVALEIGKQVRSTSNSCWDLIRGGLDGILLELPALEAKEQDGLIPLNIRIKDPVWKLRDMLDFSFSVKRGEARSIWFDLRDRILPEGRPLYITIASSSEDFDAEMLAEMAAAIGRTPEAEELRRSAAHARSHLRATWIGEDGLLLPFLRDLQTACLFALKCGVVEGSAREETKRMLRVNIGSHDGCLQTGFLGTSVIMDALTENGMVDLAYDLLLNRKCPSWLYSVDQGATTVWERWNSYTKEKGFGPVEMNSFNHYAYGAIVAWLYRCVAGIAVDSKNPGFKNIIMAPKPDRRLGHVKAEYKSAEGLIKSAWRYEGDDWIWEFTVPMGATADVTLPGENTPHHYMAGNYVIRK